MDIILAISIAVGCLILGGALGFTLFRYIIKQRYNHIIKDNLKRIPVEFLIRCLAHDNKILSLLRRYQDNPSDRQTFEKIEKYIQNDTNSSYIEIQEKLKLAVEKAKKYCKQILK